ncbi:MAG: serine/threonine-protein kinase, partial [Myxococcota bacterium]
MPTSPVAIGDVLDGKLVVERVLGQGGMGVVVAARHQHLDEQVAVKLLLPEIATSEEAAERFLREARAAVRIKSEHVARVMDVGTLDSGMPYMVMEYLEGEDLERVLARQGPFRVEEATDFVLQACDAIAEAHVAGIIHRDLKLSNLFRTARPDGSAHIKVLDFGISKHVSKQTDEDQLVLTKTGGLMGSPAFMSPEQVRSTRDVDRRTDIWSLGVILYHLLAGCSPFDSGSVGELFAAILEKDPTPLEAHRTDIPQPLRAIVRRCLDRDRTMRPSSAAELAAELAPFGSDAGKALAARIQRYYGSEVLPASSPVSSPDHSPPEADLSAAKTLASDSRPGRQGVPKGAYVVGFGTVVALLSGLGLAFYCPAPGADSTGPAPTVSNAAGSIPNASVPAASATPSSAPAQIAEALPVDASPSVTDASAPEAAAPAAST